MLNIGICPGIGAPIIKQVLPPSPPNIARPVPSAAEAAQPEETPPALAAEPSETKSSIKWWSGESFGFKDILDILNPLQHLPVISTLYRAFTGEGIGGVARIIGGAIYGRAGGFISMASSLVNAVFGAVTGKDMGERVYAAIFGDPASTNETAVARAASPERSLVSAAPVAMSSFDGPDSLTYRWNKPENDPAGIIRMPAVANVRSEPGANEILIAERPIDAASALDLYDRMAPARAETPGGLAAAEEEESRFEPWVRFADRPE
jgi:hypothetical protein